jgi:hypothetical protein
MIVTHLSFAFLQYRMIMIHIDFHYEVKNMSGRFYFLLDALLF